MFKSLKLYSLREGTCRGLSGSYLDENLGPGQKHAGETNWLSGTFLIAFLFLLAGCKVEPPKPPLVETVAVLPFDNESNDVNAPEIMQSYVYYALRPSAYRVFDIKETNEKLSERGIVDGGQLPALDPVKIASDLGVQAVLYGYISSFGYTNLGFYSNRSVGLDLKLVDGKTGQVLWQNSGVESKKTFTLDANQASQQLGKSLADQLVEKLFNSPLEEEAKLATIKALRTLPGFVFSHFDNPKGKANIAKELIRGEIRKK